MRTPKAVLKVIGIGLVMAAVVQELRKKPTERTWRGRLTFSIPYDFSIPSVERIKEAYWNIQDDHIITDRVLGVGWGVNIHALLRKMGCCRPTTGQSTQATIASRRESTAADESLVGAAPISEDDVPVFKLKLEKTYYANGFFNVTVDYDRFVRPTEGPVDLILGKTGARIQGKINRNANQNGTARIWGGARLRDYFKDNYRLGEVVDVELGSFHAIRVG